MSSDTALRTPHSALGRREWLQAAGGGFGALALQALLGRDGLLAADGPAAVNPLAPKAPHFAAKAKTVIFLFMYGGPSHVDLFDPKPELTKYHGQSIPVFDYPSGVERIRLPPEWNRVWSLDWSPDGDRLAIGFADGGLAIWNVGAVAVRLTEFGVGPSGTPVR